MINSMSGADFLSNLKTKYPELYHHYIPNGVFRVSLFGGTVGCVQAPLESLSMYYDRLWNHVVKNEVMHTMWML